MCGEAPGERESSRPALHPPLRHARDRRHLFCRWQMIGRLHRCRIVLRGQRPRREHALQRRKRRLFGRQFGNECRNVARRILRRGRRIRRERRDGRSGRSRSAAGLVVGGTCAAPAPAILVFALWSWAHFEPSWSAATSTRTDCRMVGRTFETGRLIAAWHYSSRGDAALRVVSLEVARDGQNPSARRSRPRSTRASTRWLGEQPISE
jgi:hypothetical protein